MRKASDSDDSNNDTQSDQSTRSAYVLCSAAQYHVGSLKFDSGKVNSEKCLVLRDTGANVCGVRKRLIREDQRTGKYISCISFGGRRERFELDIVPVESKYFSGPLKCCILDDPVADLIIGNISKLSKRGEEKPKGLKRQHKSQRVREINMLSRRLHWMRAQKH